MCQLPQLTQHWTSEQRHGCCVTFTSQISCLFPFFLTWNHVKKKTGGNSAPTQPRWQNHYWQPLPVPSSELHLEDTKLKDPLALEKIILCKMWLTDIKIRRHTLIECFLWEDKEKTLATFSLTQTQNETMRAFTASWNPKNCELHCRFGNAVVFWKFSLFSPPSTCCPWVPTAVSKELHLLLY